MDMDPQYRIIATLAGWTLGTRDWLCVRGGDAVSFLQALVSNDVGQLVAGQGVYAAYLTPQGRMIADVEVLHRGDHVAVSVPLGRGDELAARLDSLIFSEDARIDRPAEMAASLMVVGPEASRLAARVTGITREDLESLGELAHRAFSGGFVVRTGESVLPVFHVVTATDLVHGVAAEFDREGVVRLEPEMATALRVEVARPLWGVDMTADTIPLEAGLLDRAISTSKGCYVGQEVVIRILHRGGGRVARRLVTLAWPRDERVIPAAGAAVTAGGKDVGSVTSAAYVPSAQRVMALAYVHRDHATVGEVITVDGRPTEIVDLAH